MAIAIAIKRVAGVPEKVLVRNLHFRALAISMAVGETVYGASSVFLAWKGYGGMSIVYGNILQSTSGLLIMVSAAGFRSWLTPTPLRAARFRDMFRFGAPLAIEGIAANASRNCDNLLMSHFFGTGPMALYNMGYNLADIPAVYVGEQIGSVLLPSLSAMPRERRPAALERASGLLALIIFPMAIGLASVAPTLIHVALGPKWQGVAPLLEVLAVLAVFRPIGWALSSYLQAIERTQLYMWLEIAKLITLLGGIAILQQWGIEVAAVSVGIAFGTNAIAGVWLVATGPEPRPSPRRMFGGFARPLAACGAMALVVLAVRTLLPDMHPALRLVLEIASGAAMYVAAAFAFAPKIARDFLGLVKETLRRR
jgi:PST family polysaccharide transporter